MGATIASLDITNAELHRRDLQRAAMQVKRRAKRADNPAADAASLPVLAERRQLLLSLSQMGDAAIETEIEHVDPLGVWSYGKPRRPLVTLDTRVALDWGVWAVLMVLAGYLAAGR